MIKIVELFGGIGAVRKALERENIEFESVGYVEIDKNACKSYNALYNENYSPMSVCDYHLPDYQIDLLIHGSPCQSFSSFGLKKGGVEGSGTTSSLMWETVRAIREAKYKPKIVLWENVAVTTKYPEYQRYLEKMKELGYTNSFKILNSLDFGIPQTRNRVFTISILGDKKFDFDNLETKPMKPLEEILEKDVDWNKYKVADRTIKIMLGEMPNNPYNGRKMLVRNYLKTLTTKPDQVPNVNIFKSEDGKYRHLTELESWRGMGFDDEDFYKCRELYPVRYIRGKECKCGILYKQAGNSIVVDVLQAIVKELIKYL